MTNHFKWSTEYNPLCDPICNAIFFLLGTLKSNRKYLQLSYVLLFVSFFFSGQPISGFGHFTNSWCYTMERHSQEHTYFFFTIIPTTVSVPINKDTAPRMPIGLSTTPRKLSSSIRHMAPTQSKTGIAIITYSQPYIYIVNPAYVNNKKKFPWIYRWCRSQMYINRLSNTLYIDDDGQIKTCEFLRVQMLVLAIYPAIHITISSTLLKSWLGTARIYY